MDISRTESMNQEVPEDARLEIKFVAYETELSRLLMWLKLHSGGFFRPYPDRTVNNVYFDTESYVTYAENLSGVSRRTKIRYRWYGQSKTPDKGALEIKCKRNIYGWKFRYPIAQAPYTPKDDWLGFRRTLMRQLPPVGKKWLMFTSRPVLSNRYHRMYFTSSDDLIRATIDTRQTVWDQRYKRYPNLQRRANLPPTMVLELKFHHTNLQLAMKTIQGIPIRLSRHSKYVVGVNAIAGY